MYIQDNRKRWAIRQVNDIFKHPYVEGWSANHYLYPSEEQFREFEGKYPYCEEVDLKGLFV